MSTEDPSPPDPAFDTLDERHFKPAAAPRRVPLSALAAGKRASATAARIGPRILFDEDFAKPRAPRARAAEPPPEAPPPEPSFTAAELEDARRAAFRDGRDAGRMAARAEFEAAGQAALATIAAELGTAAGAASEAAETAAEGAVRLVLGILERLHPSLAPNLAQADIALMVSTLLPHLATEPKLTLRLCPPLVDSLRQKVQAIAAEAGFAGDIVVRPDPNIAPDGAALTWSAGAALRDPPALCTALFAALAPLGLSPATSETDDDVERTA
jgi:flagellar assembly protein FliH